MKLNVGDYVRTKDGDIGKITKIHEHKKLGKMIEIEDCYCIYFEKKDIINANPNIIDLIEENDFVNHSRVVCIGISTDLKGTHKYLVLEKGNYCPNGNIKSIVTKEQFESMEYKVKE